MDNWVEREPTNWVEQKQQGILSPAINSIYSNPQAKQMNDPIGVEEVYSFAKQIASRAGVKDWTKAAAPGIPLLAARVVALFPIVDMVTMYFEAVFKAISQATGADDAQMYSEGYALTMAFAVFGYNIDDIVYVNTETGKASPPPEGPRPEGGQMDNLFEKSVWDQSKSFYEGKQAAIEDLEKAANQKPLTEKEYFSQMVNSTMNKTGKNFPPAYNPQSAYNFWRGKLITNRAHLEFETRFRL